eukprot:5318462-Pleurochrysis_carterae.AAC.1
MEFCVPGGWVQNFLANSRVSLDRSSLFATNCVFFGDCAPRTHQLKKMRTTPVIDASYSMSSGVDMSTCSSSALSYHSSSYSCYDAGDITIWRVKGLSALL